MSLKGGTELRARMKAIRTAFKPIGRTWAQGTVEELRPRTPIRSGKTRASYRVKSATQRKAVVVGSFVAYFIDKGPKRHTITTKGRGLFFQAQGRTIFTKKVNHPGYRGRPFRGRAAHEALRKNPPAQEIIKAWNGAAR